MKRLITISIITVLSLGTLLATGGDKKKNRFRNDTSSYTEILGKIVDSRTAAPVVFATIVVTETSIATVSNTDGEFILKVPENKKDGTISFTHLGYENSTIKISDLNGGKNHIKLKAISVPIDELIIRSVDPKELIISANKKVKDNYSNIAEMQTSFYRETIRQNKKYVSVSEAVMDIYKSAYKTSFDGDRIKIYKGRKSNDVKKMDTVMVKLQGGPQTSLMLDLVKNPGDIINPLMMDYYTFKLEGVTSIDNRETYIVSFDQKLAVELPLYSGNIYIDVETHAFAGMNFSISDRGLSYASDVLVKKKPSNLDIEIENGHYLIRYRKGVDAWYLNYVRSEIALESKWKRKLFKSNFLIMLEMAVTDRDKENVQKFTGKESSRINDFFTDQVSSFEDENFWGDYNTIKPDESIEIAIQKLNKKLKRRQ